jgi:hypothetical protein
MSAFVRRHSCALAFYALAGVVTARMFGWI